MTTTTVLRGTAIGVGAGLAGAKVVQPATSKLYEHQSDEAKKQEEKASYGVTYNIAASKTAALVGIKLRDEKAAKAGTHLRGLAGHLVYGLGMAVVSEAGWRLAGGWTR